MQRFNRYMIILCSILLVSISVFLIVEKNLPALMALFR